MSSSSRTSAPGPERYTEGVLPLVRDLIDADLDRDALRAPPTMQALIEAGHDVVDVVIQDEFTHDVIVQIGALYAVYDST